MYVLSHVGFICRHEAFDHDVIRNPCLIVFLFLAEASRDFPGGSAPRALTPVASIRLARPIGLRLLKTSISVLQRQKSSWPSSLNNGSASPGRQMAPSDRILSFLIFHTRNYVGYGTDPLIQCQPGPIMYYSWVPLGLR
jgi:hypothetical protein